MNKSAIFFVSEEEYPKLQAACPNDFPFTYAQFVERVEEGIRCIPDSRAIEKTYNFDEAINELEKGNSNCIPKYTITINTLREKGGAYPFRKE